MKVTVYLNEARGHFGGFNPYRAELHEAANFTLETGEDNMSKALDYIYSQLNIGGEFVPAEPWTEAYRAAGNRSLSVGDVVVLDGVPWEVARIGWQMGTRYHVTQAVKRAQAAEQQN